MVNGRQKGASFERDCARLLFEELGLDFKRDLEQYRTSLHGDLVCSDPTFPFVIECKRYASGKYFRPAWFVQAQEAAEAANKFPALIYKFDRQDIRVALELRALAASFGVSNDSKQIIETDFAGFCETCREVMAANSENEKINQLMGALKQ